MSLKFIRYGANSYSAEMGLLCIYFCTSYSISDDQSYTWRWSDGATVLKIMSVLWPTMEVLQIATLSPNPHIRARLGCCTTSSLRVW
jgi:hypothetical protein